MKTENGHDAHLFIHLCLSFPGFRYLFTDVIPLPDAGFTRIPRKENLTFSGMA